MTQPAWKPKKISQFSRTELTELGWGLGCPPPPRVGGTAVTGPNAVLRYSKESEKETGSKGVRKENWAEESLAVKLEGSGGNPAKPGGVRKDK